MKILFGVQTEGNGHITQALATKQYLKENGHDVNTVFAANKSKGLSKYFTDEFNVITYAGFDFVFDKKGRVIIWKTLIKNYLELPKLLYSFFTICRTIRKERPDVIVNFYEPLIGLTALVFPKIKYVSIAHQYATTLPMYPKISGFPVQKIFLKLINYVTSIRSTKIALSYYEFQDDTVVACPPILRNNSYVLKDNQEDFILVYLMEEGMLKELINEAKKHPDKQIECFTKLTKPVKDLPTNLTVRPLDGESFQERMKVCKAVVCSGGFETSSEAIYQMKPLLMVPMPNHYEQYANCTDAYLHNFALFFSNIDLDKIPHNQYGNTNWFDQRKVILNKVFTN